ncbi:MAG: hypothetical protein U1F54_12765 [Burkholderiales bacterium]
MPKTTEPRFAVTARLKKQYYDALVTVAENEGRSLAATIEQIIARYCKANGIAVGAGRRKSK